MKKSTPPAVATWVLNHFASDPFVSRTDEAIAGDLMEHFQEGRSRLWYWRQVLVAIARPENWSVWLFARVLIVGWLILSTVVPPVLRLISPLTTGPVYMSMLIAGLLTGGILALLNRPNHLVPILLFAASCFWKDLYRLISPGIQSMSANATAPGMYINTWLLWTGMNVMFVTGVIAAGILLTYRSPAISAKPTTIG